MEGEGGRERTVDEEDDGLSLGAVFWLGNIGLQPAYFFHAAFWLALCDFACEAAERHAY